MVAAVIISVDDLDRETFRALVEAGYAPLSDYLAFCERLDAPPTTEWKSVECGGCAPPVYVIPPTLSDNEGTPIEQVFRIRHDAGADLTEPFHARPHNEGAQRNHA